MTTVGMDAEALESFAGAAEQASDDIDAMLREAVGPLVLATLASNLPGIWRGTGASSFAQAWQSTHVQQLRALRDVLRRTARSAREQVRQQREASGDRSAPTLRSESVASSPDHGRNRVAVRGRGDANEIAPNDIRQMNLEDCALLAALGSLAAVRPERLRDNIAFAGSNEQGDWYKVRIYDPTTGEPHDVTVLDSKDAIARPGDGGERWVQLYERAMAQYLGDGRTRQELAEVWSGDARSRLADKCSTDPYAFFRQEGWWGRFSLSMLTGQKGEQIPMSSGRSTVYAGLDDVARGERVAVLGSAPHRTVLSGGREIIKAHAYSVLKVDASTRTVTVRNPWGTGKAEFTMTYDEVIENFGSLHLSAMPA